jgi:hypothetical protein
MGAVMPVPVSAGTNRVFFRDGDTKIRYLTPSGQTGDVTTVPGGPKVSSSFSVSPDEKRIAVAVEDFSGVPTINLEIYVEDLIGGGNHSVIYTTPLAEGKGGANLWPLGWQNGNLILAVVSACSFEWVPRPFAWHIADAGTALRQYSVGSATCRPGWWPSPAGLACLDYKKSQTIVYDWSGRITATVSSEPGDTPALSPSGSLLLVIDGGGYGNPSPVTSVYKVSGGSPLKFPGAMACLWIDETAMLAPNAVIQYPSGAIVRQTPNSQCAGRFPGGL